MLNTDGRHPALQEFRDAFEFDHLSEGLPRVVAAAYHDQAARLLALLPDAATLTRAIHDLWRSKNEAVLLATRVRTGGNGGAEPPVTFRGTTNPAHAVAPVQRTELRAQDRHPDHQPGRPDGPVNARYADVAQNPFDWRDNGQAVPPWFTPITVPGSSGEPIDVTTYADMVEQHAAVESAALVDAGEWPGHDEDQPDTSDGRHTLNDSTPRSAFRHETADPPKSGLSFVNDAGDPVPSHEVFPAQRPGSDATD